MYALKELGRCEKYDDMFAGLMYYNKILVALCSKVCLLRYEGKLEVTHACLIVKVVGTCNIVVDDLAELAIINAHFDVWCGALTVHLCI